MLVHADIRDTAIYLHLSQRHLRSIPNPVDKLTMAQELDEVAVVPTGIQVQRKFG
jgi:hypothetical protein